MSCANLFWAIIHSAETQMTQINLNGLSVKQQKPIKDALPLDSISLMHISTTIGLLVKCAFTSVVRSQLYTFLTCFRSGLQSFGTILEHCLCTFKPQSEGKNENMIRLVFAENVFWDQCCGIQMALAGSDLSSQQLLLFMALNHQIPEEGTALKPEGFPTQDIYSVSGRSNTEWQAFHVFFQMRS